MCHIRINSLSVHSNYKVLSHIKDGKELIRNLGYETPQSDTKHQKLLECILTENSKLYLGNVYTEEQLTKLNEEEVEKLLIIMKPSSQARW